MMRWVTLFNEGDIWQYFSYTDNLMALKPKPPCQFSLWEETGVLGENPRLSAERWLYSFHMRTGFQSTLRWTLLGIEPVTLEVKGEWSDHYTTEAPKVVKELSEISDKMAIACMLICIQSVRNDHVSQLQFAVLYSLDQ